MATNPMDLEKSGVVMKTVLKVILEQPVIDASMDDIIGGILLAAISLIDRTDCPACKQVRAFDAANLFLVDHGIELWPTAEHELNHTGEAEEEYAGHA